MLHANRYASIARRIIHLLSCLIHYKSCDFCFASDGRAWKVDGRAKAIVGPGLATSLCILMHQLEYYYITNGKHGFLVIYVWKSTHLKAYVCGKYEPHITVLFPSMWYALLVKK